MYWLVKRYKKISFKQKFITILILIGLNLILYLGKDTITDFIVDLYLGNNPITSSDGSLETIEIGGECFEDERLNLRFITPAGFYLATSQELDDKNANIIQDPSLHANMLAYTYDSKVNVFVFTHSLESDMSIDEYAASLNNGNAPFYINCDGNAIYHPVEFAGETYLFSTFSVKSKGMELKVFCRKIDRLFVSIWILHKEGIDIKDVYNSFSSYE